MTPPQSSVMSIAQRIASELGVRVAQIDAAAALLDDKATVPFIARYRKEVTGGLDDTQLRTIEERLAYLRELDERRGVILKSVEEQGKLTPELAASIAAADTKARLEDLYLPYKPKRRTRAQIAREAGLEPLALALLGTPTLIPEQAASAYISAERGVPDAAAALDGARAILIERFSENAELVGGLRQWLWERGEWSSAVVTGKEDEGAKFADYFNAAEPVRTIPAHRALALLRGRTEGVLRLAVTVPDDGTGIREAERRIAGKAGVEQRGRPADPWLAETVRRAWKVRLMPQLALETEQRLRDAAETEAIRVFGRNLHDLLLASPAGQRVTMGLDPGIRTGVKIAVVDGTGKLLATATVYPHEPRNDWEGTLRTLGGLCAQHHVELLSIGNGTASRETDRLAGDLIKRHPELPLTKVIVSEAGASVYSASELAAREFPDLDVSLRGAVSIARRLQDPLAELVRIEPKAIGVGQYQHDVSPMRLAKKLDAVVEDCVNAVGADVNTASTPLLARISGLNESIARNIVSFRDAHGPFRDRRQVLEVPRLGERTYQQAAGFLRITNGANPLDASAVHPEAYPVVERIVARTGVPIGELMGNARMLRGLRPEEFADATFGALTVKDILAELEKPGRDPRPAFRTAVFKDSVQTLQDVEPGMQLEGVVTNVANFGAFVDIGVHQDGLVHVSQLADRFIKDPREVVKAGDIVTVTVVEVDLKRRRIALTMKKGPPKGGPHELKGPSEGDPHELKGPSEGDPHELKGPPKGGPHELKGPSEGGPHGLRDASEGQRGARPAGGATGDVRPNPAGRMPRRPDETPSAAPNTSIAAAFSKLAPSRSRD